MDEVVAWCNYWSSLFHHYYCGVDLVRIAGIMGREKDNHSMVVILICISFLLSLPSLSESTTTMRAMPLRMGKEKGPQKMESKTFSKCWND